MRENEIDDMTNEMKTPRAMVVLAGESIWPVLSLAAHGHNGQDGLRTVCLYHTAQPAESLLPALRLRHLLSALFSNVQVVLPDNVGGLSPQEVRWQIDRWLPQQPDGDWILLGSSSLSSWNLGLATFVGQPRLQVISRESPGAWYEWQRSGDRDGIVLEKLPGFASGGTDALAIETLLKSQFMTSDKSPLYSAQSGGSLPIHRLSEFGAANGWDWPAAFKDNGLDASASPAALFARYLAASLGELGITNLAHAIKITPQPETREKESIEIDLVANTGGQLVVLDARLEEELDEERGSVKPILRQIQQLAGLRRQLSALAPRLVMIRPCRLFSEAERAMARACDLEVVDQAEAPKLFSRLASLLKISPLPQPLADIEKTLVELITLRGRRRVFGPEAKLTREQESLSGTPVLVDIEKHLAQLCAERGQNWVLWATRTHVFLRLARPPVPPAQMPWLIQNSLKRFGRVQVEEMLNGYEAVFSRSDGLLTVLRQALGGYVNRPLDPLIFIQAAPPTPPPPRRPLPKAAFLAPAGSLMDELDNVIDKAVCKPDPGPKKNSPV